MPPWSVRLWVAKQIWVARATSLAGFRLDGQRYAYFFHPYNRTWQNERQVEVPIARRWLRGTGAEELLEVGNVLQNYGVRGHTVVDKYEAGPGVTNIDILDYAPDRRFRRIISISTLEHVGWDEPTQHAEAFDRAVARLRRLLSPDGELLFTVPLGYNPAVDRFVRSPPSDFHVRFLARAAQRPGRWVQRDQCDPDQHRYSQTSYAQAVAVVHCSHPA